jgi:hypothetical protein
MSRRQAIIFALLGLSLGVSIILTLREPKVVTTHQGCLTDVDCLKGERCTVFPKDDGLVTPGVCAEPCVDDAACGLNGWKCLGFVEGDGVLVPVGTRGARGPPVNVCVAGARSR